MSETWAAIDARGQGRGIGATTMVAGIPLVVRQARTFARAGGKGVRIAVADVAERRSVQACFRRHPAPDGFAVELGDASVLAAPGQLRLDPRGIYAVETLSGGDGTTPPAPDLLVSEPADVRKAERFLFARIRKSVELDGLISYYVIRPFSRVFTRLLLGTRMSPNQVTVCALACGLTAAVLAGIGGQKAGALAGLLYWLGGVIDHVDGELARLRLQSSKIGEWLDSMTDEASTFSLLAGLGLGLFRDGQGGAWAIIGIGGSVLGVATVGRLYLDLHRLGLPIDTAQFPWFFRSEDRDDGRPGEPTVVGRIIDGVGFLVRRDANVTIVAALLILGLRPVATAAIGAGVAVAFALTTTHYLIARRAP